MKKIIFSFLSVICLSILTSGCGLDVFYVIESPVVRKIIDSYSEANNRVFEFQTVDQDVTGLLISGTDVYYKIYSNIDTVTNEVSVINNTNNNSSSPDVTVLSNRGYVPLRVNGHENDVLIEKTSSSNNVKIRLTDNNDSSDYSAKVLVDNNYICGTPEKSIPVRNRAYVKNNTSSLSFNFGVDGTPIPVSEDKDSAVSSDSTISIYYVSMFAITKGYDASFRPYYSEPAYLGYIRIISGSTSEN